MKIINFLIAISLIYLFFYTSAIVLIIYALINYLLTFEEFLNFLIIIGSFFSMFFSILLTFINKNKAKNLTKNKTRINILYVSFSFFLISILGSTLIFGIIMDLFNTGFNSNIELSFYFLIVETSIGLYTGNLISDLFNFINDIKFEDLNH